MNKILLLIAYTFLAFNVSCKKDPTSSNNTAPIASFVINPTSGTAGTVFEFDASRCTDNEDGASALEVRWNWNNDDMWDTDYSTIKTATHQYSTVGTHTIELEVKDSKGLTNTITNEITVYIQYAGTFSDVDGNIYNTIQIGNQLWMAENLKVTNYSNSELIPNVTGSTEWINLSTGAYCSYDNNDSNIDTYGLLYNWYAVEDSRSLAPAGWHIPTDAEWKQLEMYLGMSQEEADAVGHRGMDEGGKLKEGGTTHFYSPNWRATNSTGFSAIPGGGRVIEADGVAFNGVGYGANIWSSTAYSSGGAWTRLLGSNRSSIYRSNHVKQAGLSVRCIKD
ncbi:FISUMP domain-containing protein [Candidatus Neomarinimicrobiota bacterium]